MYRLIIILSIISAHQCCQCHWSSRAPIDEYFNNVADKVIDADRRARSVCISRRCSIKEVYGEESYKYIVKVPQGTDSGFVVKVKNRVLLVQGNGSCRSISQVKVLPDLVDYRRATWQFENDELVVTVPYAGRNGDLKMCGIPDFAERTLPNSCKTEIY